MATITIDENINLEINHFITLEDFQLYLVKRFHHSELSPAHKAILDNRLADAKENPEDSISFDELKTSIRRN